jgi:hypothetical protein
VTLPDEYRAAEDVLLSGLETDVIWRMNLEGETPHVVGRAITAALVLIGPTPPLYVEPWHGEKTGALGARVFTSDALVTLDVGASNENLPPEATVAAVPLLVESLALAASSAPWDEPHGAVPKWPGNLTATVRIAGMPDPLTVPSRPIDAPEHRAAVEKLVHHLADRLKGSTPPPGVEA